MDEYEFIKSLQKIIKENVTLSCGLKFFDDSDGVFMFTVTETNDDIALWRLNEMLDTLKKDCIRVVCRIFIVLSLDLMKLL